MPFCQGCGFLFENVTVASNKSNLFETNGVCYSSPIKSYFYEHYLL